MNTKALTESESEDARSKDDMLFYAYYGLALSSWSRVEDKLAHVFCTLMQASELLAAERVFYAGPGFQGQLQMVAALVEYRLSKVPSLRGAHPILTGQSA